MGTQNTTGRNFEVFESERFPIKAWVRGVEIDEGAKRQLAGIASLPFVHRWVAAMPDVHVGKGATVGSVIATHRAIIPAAVGVDIGCGMIAAAHERLPRPTTCRTTSAAMRDLDRGRRCRTAGPTNGGPQ